MAEQNMAGQKMSEQKMAGQKQAVTNKKSALETVVTRNEFYRDGYRRLQMIALIEAAALAIMVLLFVVTLSILRGHDRFFATTADGRLIQLVPLDQPNLPDAKLLSWSAEAATEVMTFGFHDYRKRLQDSSRFFTRSGWESFNQALTSSRILESVSERQQVVTAVPRSAPVILQEGLVNGVYRWYVQIPLNITYQSGNTEQNTPQLITLVIVRVSTLETPDGIAIEQWIAEQSTK